MAWIRWQKDLRSPKVPGPYPMPWGGLVEVTEDNIKTAAEVDGKVKFELIDVTSNADHGKRYRLGHADRL